MNYVTVLFIFMVVTYNFTGGSDYASGPYNVTIPAGQTSGSFDVPIINDNVLESHENLMLAIAPESLPKLVSHGNPDMATVTIVNDDSKQLFLL